MDVGLYLTFGLYLLVLIGIGVYFFVRTDLQRLADYMLGGRDVGTWPIAISEVASVASGWTFFAWVGIGFTTGVSGLWLSVTMTLLVLFMYRYVAPTFRQQSEVLDSQTIVDHLALCFRDQPTGRAIRLVATAAVALFMVSYIGAQIIAVGEAMDTGLGIDYVTAVLVGGLAVALYTTLGGFNASVWTDFVQGVLVFAAAIALPVAAIVAVGGWGTFIEEARSLDASLLAMDAGLGGWELGLFVLGWIAFAFGTIGQPHSLMRFQAIRSVRLLSPASVIAVAFQSLRLTVPLVVGIAGRVLYDAVDDPEAVAMMMLVDLFPGWMAGLLLAGIIGAILSTSDSMMLVASADLTRLYETYINPDAERRTLIILGRGIVALLALLGIALALTRPGTIFDIIEFAFVGLGVTLGLPLLFLIFWPRTTGAGVLAAVVVGLTSSVGNLYLAPDLFPIVVWPVTIGALVLVSYATSAPVSSSRSNAS